jgi:hypothetical protein
MPVVDFNLTEIDAKHAQSEPGMAHFAGTGPSGETCGNCAFKGYSKLSNRGRAVHHGGCNKFYTLTGKHGPFIIASLLACKYFKKVAAPEAPQPTLRTK